MKYLLVLVLVTLTLAVGCSNPTNVSENGIILDSGCVLEEKYALSSYGPYDAVKLEGVCHIVAPVRMEKCLNDADCDCSSYAPPASNLPKEVLQCSCLEQQCYAVVE